jgi:hypothetical protein
MKNKNQVHDSMPGIQKEDKQKNNIGRSNTRLSQHAVKKENTTRFGRCAEELRKIIRGKEESHKIPKSKRE